ncbi:MAG: phosphoribosylformylglycinamidine synthase [Deltaproteobacteria bacterium]|jgi:phosphoribosylformylglycinamidine synthase|nr:phosphoribosylformylglycinamidine synthase [Deltaproteobacteria bacterium]
MPACLLVRPRPHLPDVAGQSLVRRVRSFLGLELAKARLVKVFTVEGLSPEELRLAVDRAALHDPVLQEASLKPFASEADWILEIGFKPGVTDNEGRTARDTLALVLERDRNFSVYTAVRWHITAALRREEIERIARDLLANELIQRHTLADAGQWRASPGFPPHAAKVTGAPDDAVAVLPLSKMADHLLLALSKERTLALSLEEMRAIRDHYLAPETAAARSAMGLPADPTDVELEALAQTWSEHCKHKIFASRILYRNLETGCSENVDSLYKTCIQEATAILRQRLGDEDFCRSVFKDNAGVVAFTETHDLCIKVETHNSPSALDPYGGALTGIMGVNRDPMGTGLGAALVCNTDVFCFAPPFDDSPLPPRLLHPRRVMEGVREGVEHGGNRSGVPTVNGAIVFDPRYLGKPLVHCGTVGLLPRRIHGRPGYEKAARPGDRVVMVGGRIGKDGIHGATFSSEALHEGSPVTAVQIGDPITQRKMYDCLLRARDLGLYSAITDNGAGGLSSSVGEMAEETGGCRLDLARAPLKYDGLRPWEILLSEAQERMTLAVPPKDLPAFLQLAREMDVEATDLGEFTSSGYFQVTFRDRTVAWLPLDFFHHGLPRLELAAEWTRPAAWPPGRSALTAQNGKAADLEAALAALKLDQRGLLLAMLGRLNICSKEYLIRQYDHEVKGGSVVKPLVGAMRDGPADAAVLRPLLDVQAGIVLSNGICPKFSDADTYWMTANALDEAIRNAVATGADPERLAGVDNFCWCDPVQSEQTPDGTYKLAQLVRSAKALRHFCLAFGLPCVSGKDSMKNDYTGGGSKISIPPTVLFSILGYIPDVNLAVTPDFKKPGDLVYLLGTTRSELGGSELACQLGLSGGRIPEVDPLSAKNRYRLIFRAIQGGLINACHDLSDGGLAVALAEMSLGGRLGADLDLDAVPVPEGDKAELLCRLYAESASRLLVAVPPDRAAAFQNLLLDFQEEDAACLGRVTRDSRLILRSRNAPVCAVEAEELARAFKATLAW